MRQDATVVETTISRHLRQKLEEPDQDPRDKAQTRAPPLLWTPALSPPFTTRQTQVCRSQQQNRGLHKADCFANNETAIRPSEECFESRLGIDAGGAGSVDVAIIWS